MIKNIKAGQDGREIMRAKSKQYSSSQISPSGEIWESPRDMSGMYTHMLLYTNTTRTMGFGPHS